MKRVDSTAVTPGSRASAWRAPSLTGSIIHTDTSLRIDSVNWVSTMTSIASRKKLPITTIATAAATPPIDSAVRSGRRSMLRRIMRIAAPVCTQPRRSSSVRR